MKFPFRPGTAGGPNGKTKTKKTRQQSIRHISLDLDLDLYLLLKIDTLPIRYLPISLSIYPQ